MTWTGDSRGALEFLDEHYDGERLNEIRTFAVASFSGQWELPEPKDMAGFYRLAVYASFSYFLYLPGVAKNVVDGQPVHVAVMDSADKAKISLMSPIIFAGWKPPLFFTTYASIGDADRWNIDCGDENMVTALIDSLPFYKPETRRRVLSRIIRHIDEADDSIWELLALLSPEEIAIVAAENIDLLAYHNPVEPIPGLSASYRVLTAHMDETEAGNALENLTVMGSITADKEHLDELAERVFSAEARRGVITRNGLHPWPRLFSHHHAGVTWHNLLDEAEEGGGDWPALRYGIYPTYERRDIIAPALQAIFNRAIETGIYEIEEKHV